MIEKGLLASKMATKLSFQLNIHFTDCNIFFLSTYISKTSMETLTLPLTLHSVDSSSPPFVSFLKTRNISIR